MTMQTNPVSVRSRIKALQERHANLSRKIEQEMKHPATNDIALKRLKLEKLRLKETIEIVSKHASAH